MYEVPAHGAMLLCDKAGLDAHESIFLPGREAVYYDDIGDAIAKIEFYLLNEDERVQVAKGGYSRMWRDYEWQSNLRRLLDWASGLRKERPEPQ